VLRVAHKIVQQLQRGVVGPVQIVEQQQQRPMARERLQQLADAFPQPRLIRRLRDIVGLLDAIFTQLGQ